MRRLIVTVAAVAAYLPVWASPVLEVVVVTATREAQPLGQVTSAVSVFDEEQIRFIAPSHPSELLNRSAGVYVNNLGGEGHMTAIRQPLTTAGVYLFLEDGVPTRPTGFFNHNGLYEVDVAQASRVEVIKGPGSAVYGSDAIAGVVNSITAVPSDEFSAELGLEAGDYGWQKVTADLSGAGLRWQFTGNRNDGYRDASMSDRASTLLRMDNEIGIASVKTIFSATAVNQSGISPLGDGDYRSDPRRNLFQGSVAYRDVRALRLSSEWRLDLGAADELTLTPFYRWNTTELMPSWMVSYDPNIADTRFQTYGLLSQWRHQFEDDSVLLVGVDLDLSPSEYREDRLQMFRQGDVYTGYARTGQRTYDFDAEQTSISPYVQGEWQLPHGVRLLAGVRYDYFRVNYDDRLAGQPADPRYRRPPSQTAEFEQWSPKLGATWQVTDWISLYANYHTAFRVPSVGNLFRSGSSLGTDTLAPVEALNKELGARMDLSADWYLGVAVYELTKDHDLVSIIDAGTRRVVNAGETEHRGIEVELQGQLTDTIDVQLGWTWTRQTYERFSVITGSFPNFQNTAYDGNDIPRAPGNLGQLAVGWRALTLLRLEWSLERVGAYYLDDANTGRYDGHTLQHLRGSYQLTDALEIYARIYNLTDRRHSVYSSLAVNTGEAEYQPGYPRTGYLGVRWRF